MAVDYFHRLLVSGKPADVSAFRDGIYREYPRTIAGKTWTEIVPFSFAGLYELAPAARRVEPEIPDDPYDLSAWPVRTVEGERAEIRYQMHTRNCTSWRLPRGGLRRRSRSTRTIYRTGRCARWVSVQRYATNCTHAIWS